MIRSDLLDTDTTVSLNQSELSHKTIMVMYNVYI